MKISLLSCMPHDVQRNLVQKHYGAGSSMLLSDYENNYVFFLMSGYAEAYIQNAEGSMAFIFCYEPNSVFGEIEPFYEGNLKPVSIIAITNCDVKILHKDHFLAWLKNDFNAVKVLIQTISEKLVKNGLLIEEMSLMTVRERVLRCISIYHYRNMLPFLSKRQIALEANTPIRSVNRALMQCYEQGILCYKDKSIEILNEEVLYTYLPTYLQKK